MRLLGLLLGAAIALAALKIAAQAAMVFLLLAVAVCLIRAPVQTLTVLLGLVLIGTFAQQPMAGLLFLLVALAARYFAER